jgi:hypothetical protein
MFANLGHSFPVWYVRVIMLACTTLTFLTFVVADPAQAPRRRAPEGNFVFDAPLNVAIGSATNMNMC